jgi:UDP-N-acetyl-2-amino-2-deoxyglucuronate dehydrogenase
LEQEVHVHSHDRAGGFLRFQKARVRWFLSINSDLLPPEAMKANQRTYRVLKIDGDQFTFSQGFEDLHTRSYQAILNQSGFSLTEALSSIQIVHQIRAAIPLGANGRHHPLVEKPLEGHPFGFRLNL